ncbi:hypothetical protein Q4591_07120 [Shewanella sp. 3_MG-2023]|uniref:hypothetical protein n=1 Tax=Shewanella sp. 3_MG-2023 TaxID=3062635 RepID=UPI0026E3B369|nr:hypothetical protein [Shewanella sp. 3_MG-2023]MDO6775121.1 hypothetical protein [Shewanella sp. 3_MG-2023]
MRTTRALDQQAWLFTFAEPKLVGFAHRIELELPDSHVVIRESKPNGSMELTTYSYKKKSSLLPNESRSFTLSIGDIFYKKQTNALLNRTIKDVQVTSSSNLSIELLGRFREKIISTFDSPF